MNKRFTVLVSNDLVHDQRVKKTCDSLLSQGYDITLVGRKVRQSKPIYRAYKTVRFNLFFESGALFYAMLNVRLFFYLLFVSTDFIWANDLDTLPAAHLVSRLRGKKLIYDSHEFFTEAAGLTGREFQKSVWTKIEKSILPKLGSFITVNDSIKEKYELRYSCEVAVVRNVPFSSDIPTVNKEELGLPADKKIVILQGAYLDIDRGAVDAVLAMKDVEGAILLVIGAGAEWDLSKGLAAEHQLGNKVIHLPKLPFEELRKYTAIADLGLSLDKPIHDNYKYSLPNKLFDYVHSEVPVLTSDLPELRKIVKKYNLGALTRYYDTGTLAHDISEALMNPSHPEWKENAKLAALELNWNTEQNVVFKFLKRKGIAK